MGEDCEEGLYGRSAIKKLLLRKQNNVKRFQWAKVHKDWTIEKSNKDFWTDESNRRVSVQGRVGEELRHPVSHKP